MFENQPDALDLFSLQNHLPRDSFKPSPQLPAAVNEISTVQRSGPVHCSLAVQGWYPVFCLVPSSKDPEHLCLMITQGLHITILSFCKYELQQSSMSSLTPPSRQAGSCHQCTSKPSCISLGFFNSFLEVFLNTVSQCEV